MAKSIFGRIVDVLNTPLPQFPPIGGAKPTGKAKAAEAEKPAAKSEAKPAAKSKSKAPAHAGAPPVVIPPSIVVNKAGQTKAIDITAELRKRQAALKEQAALAETAALKKKLAEQEAELTWLRHEYEQKLAEEAKTHTATEAWTYTVARGDTLWGISSKMYGKGARWKEMPNFCAIRWHMMSRGVDVERRVGRAGRRGSRKDGERLRRKARSHQR